MLIEKPDISFCEVVNESESSKEVDLQKNAKNYYSYLSQIEKQLQAKVGTDISFRPPIIKDLTGNGIVYPSTINMIQGKTGVHKSRLMESIASLILANDPDRVDLCFQIAAVRDYALVYVDTERNKSDQLPAALQKIIQKSGLNGNPRNFRYTSLIDVPRDMRFKATSDFIAGIKEELKEQHLVIVFDVVTDCVFDINNNRECFPLIDMINREINNSNVTFFVIIHENPGVGEKARGALGTELGNKSSTTLQISFEKDKTGNDTDLIKLRYLKTRGGKRPDPVYLKYDEISHGLELAPLIEVDAAQKEKGKMAEIESIIDYISNMMKLNVPIPSAKLKAEISEKFNISEPTANRRLKEIAENRTEIRDADFADCVLMLSGASNKSSYILSKKQDTIT